MSAFIIIPMLLITTYLHLEFPCRFICFICLVSFVIDIRLNTLAFVLLTASGTHNFAYGSLILLRLPLHLTTL